MEKRLKKYLENGEFVNVDPSRSRIMARIRSKNNRSTEVRMRMSLVASRVKGWRLQLRTLPGNPDIYFPMEKLAVFVDGCYWHGCPKCGHIPNTRKIFWRAKIERNKDRDALNTKKLKTMGIRVIRVWEHDLINPQTRKANTKRIVEVLRTAKSQQFVAK